MNPGITVYVCLEALATAYGAFVFFQMGRNRIERYAMMRRQLSSKLSFMDSSKVCYALAGGLAVFLVFRVVEHLMKYGTV